MGKLISIGFALTCAFISLGVSPNGAKAGPDSHAIFKGRNVYSPWLEYDEASQSLKMWYGGWQAPSDYPHDKIYYRTSKDGSAWSAPRTVLSPAQLPVRSAHVNDPSIVKVMNSITRKPQYTMFYTVCVRPCASNSDNQLWTSVSADGLNWTLHRPLITTGGAAVPSAVEVRESGRAVWRVFYSNTSEANNSPTHIFMAEVDGRRNVLRKDVIVYTHSGPGVLANPEVRNINGTWNLLFNVYHTRPGAKRNTADVYLAQSNNPVQWRRGSARPLIMNDPAGDVCATIAPTLVAVRDRLLVQFGQALYSRAGICDFSNFGTMEQMSVGQDWLYKQP